MSQSAVLLLFIGLMMAMFMFSLNQNMLATALPTIVGELNGVDLMLWVSTAFMLASTAVMPIYGKIGDLFGRKKLFVFAIAVFMVGAVCGLVAQDMRLLILGRVLQGIGGGGLMILSQAIIASVVPARQRGKYMGIMGSVFAVSSVAGPLVGGWLTEGPGWRWAFVINFPLGLCALLAAAIFLKLPKTKYEVRPKLDIAGMVLVSAFTSALVLVSAWGGNTYEWTSPVILGLCAVVVVTAVAFVLVERVASEPIIPLWLFKDKNFVLSTSAGLMVAVAMFGVIGYMPTYLQMTHGVSASVAGFMMIPNMGFMLVSSTLVGFVVARTGRYKIYPLVGITLVGVSLVLMSLLRADTNAWVTMGFIAVLGLGIGLSQQMLVLVVQNAFPVAMVGVATASSNFFRQIGSSLGMSIVGSLFTSRLMSNLSGSLPEGAASGGASAASLTPELVKELPAPVHDAVVTSYNDALVPLYLFIVPLVAVGLVLAFFIKEVPLATKLDRGAPSRARVDEENSAEAPRTTENTAPEQKPAELTSPTGSLPSVRSTSDEAITATSAELAATGTAPLDTVVSPATEPGEKSVPRSEKKSADDRVPSAAGDPHSR
ncbi:MDR family MFS transporter [Brevibacterium samyangense]